MRAAALIQHGIRLTCAILFVAGLAQAEPPRLTVLIIAEQFRSDALDRYADDLSENGLGRLLANGARFRRCRFEMLTTLAAPAAATLATGAWPNRHGIVGDSWYDPYTWLVVDAAGDPEQFSPRMLSGSTLADELALASGGRSRTVAISDSAAPAVLLAGRQPAGCYWRDAHGAFTTSDYYAPATPDWVGDFSFKRRPRRAGPLSWKALGAAPGSPALRLLDGDSFLGLYLASPFAVEETLAFAREAVERERLGTRDHADMLIVNLSAPALLGLETGADSPLMRDMTLRLDRSIGELLDWLDERVGLANTLVVFTGAHGIPVQRDEPPPRGPRSARRIDGERAALTMNAALEKRFGPEIFVERYHYPFVYLSPAAGRMPLDERREAIRTAGEAALTIHGIRAYWSPEIASASESASRAFARSRYPGRSGDLLLAYEPDFVETYGDGHGVSSGSFYRYDTDVPLVISGPRIRAGLFESTVEATSLAPTLAALLEIAVPSLTEGEALTQILLPPTVTTSPQVGPPPPALE